MTACLSTPGFPPIPLFGSTSSSRVLVPPQASRTRTLLFTGKVPAFTSGGAHFPSWRTFVGECCDPETQEKSLYFHPNDLAEYLLGRLSKCAPRQAQLSLHHRFNPMQLPTSIAFSLQTFVPFINTTLSLTISLISIVSSTTESPPTNATISMRNLSTTYFIGNMFMQHLPIPQEKPLACDYETDMFANFSQLNSFSNTNFEEVPRWTVIIYNNSYHTSATAFANYLPPSIVLSNIDHSSSPAMTSPHSLMWQLSAFIGSIARHHSPSPRPTRYGFQSQFSPIFVIHVEVAHIPQHQLIASFLHEKITQTNNLTCQSFPPSVFPFPKDLMYALFVPGICNLLICICCIPQLGEVKEWYSSFHNAGKREMLQTKS
ncbi:hypothetical protein KP509_01G094700 [Ceratopteris richardii]|uniref:Uncharacterized protein n=1 Tax=Ceratopteris richardii TaxID=49495 RepID=A0A8T2VM04_CERRI|nr:hypothetical protein KP509_01G094700 [Ceratopteris richardii]